MDESALAIPESLIDGARRASFLAQVEARLVESNFNGVARIGNQIRKLLRCRLGVWKHLSKLSPPGVNPWLGAMPLPLDLQVQAVDVVDPAFALAHLAHEIRSIGSGW